MQNRSMRSVLIGAAAILAFSLTMVASRAEDMKVWVEPSPAHLGETSTVYVDKAPAGTPITLSVDGTPLQTSMAENVGLVAQVSPGGNFTCAILDSGQAGCWGDNFLQQLGFPNAYQTSRPTQAVGLDVPLVQVSASRNQACALTISNMIACWGYQHGSYPFIYLSTLTETGNIARISTGSMFLCIITNEKAVKCRGSNSGYRLGVSNVESTTYFVSPDGLGEKVDDLDTYENGTCVVTESGSVKCWGEVSAVLPFWLTSATVVPGLESGAKQISLSWSHSCAAMRDGGVKCWGFNNEGQLGLGADVGHTFTATSVPNLPAAVKSVATGSATTCALLVTNEIACWGGLTESATPTVFPGNDFRTLTADGNHFCAIHGKGALSCWGPNASGQLGNGNEDGEVARTPVEVTDLSAFGTKAVLPPLALGEHVITAASGDLPPVSTTLTVTRTQTVLRLTVPGGDQPSGDPLALTAYVYPRDIVGQIAFFDGSTEIGRADVSNGTAVLRHDFVQSGQHTIKAVFAGDGSHEASTSNEQIQTIHKRDVLFRSSFLNEPTKPFEYNGTYSYGQKFSLKFSGESTDGSDIKPTGTIKFSLEKEGQFGFPIVERTLKIVDGSVTINLGTLTPYNYKLYFYYSGDDHFIGGAPYFVNTVAFKVVKASTWINLSTTRSKGDDTRVTLDADVINKQIPDGYPTGKLEFFRNNRSIGFVSLKDGHATLTADITGPITVFHAEYAMNSRFEGSASERKIYEQQPSAVEPVIIDTAIDGPGSTVSSAPLKGGRFVSVWTESIGVHMQIRDSSGKLLGPETEVYNDGANLYGSPKVAALPDGGFVVVWQSAYISDYTIWACLFDTNGQKIGKPIEVHVNDPMINDEAQYPDVAVKANGDFAISWMNFSRLFYGEVRARVFDIHGTALTKELIISPKISGDLIPSIGAVTNPSHFVVVWSTFNTGNMMSSIQMREILSDNKLSATRHLITESGHSILSPKLLSNGNGLFTVAWTSAVNTINVAYAGRFQRFTAKGLPLGTPTYVCQNVSTKPYLSIFPLKKGNIGILCVFDKSIDPRKTVNYVSYSAFSKSNSTRLAYSIILGPSRDPLYDPKMIFLDDGSTLFTVAGTLGFGGLDDTSSTLGLIYK